MEWNDIEEESVLKQTDKDDNVEEELEEDVVEEDRVCMFYVIDKITGILENDEEVGSNYHANSMKIQLEKFKDELIYNLGVNTLNNH